MKVLVTGHHGYIGSVLAPFLAAAGHDVTGYDTQLYRGCDFVPERSPTSGRSGDLRDVIPADLVGFDAIVHYGALSNDPLGDLDASLTEAINRDATSASQPRPAMPASDGSFSRRHALCTGHPARTMRWTRTRRCDR